MRSCPLLTSRNYPPSTAVHFRIQLSRVSTQTLAPNYQRHMRICHSCILLLSLFSAASVFADKPYRIGAVLPLTGDSALGGQACSNGLDLAVRELTKADASSITLKVEDNAGSASQTVTAYQKLHATSGLDAVVVWEDAAALALAPLTERQGQVLIATSGDRAIIAGRKHAFLYWLGLDTEVERIVAESKRRGYKRLARVITQHPGPIFMRAELDRIGSSQFTVAFDEEVPVDARDFRPILLKLKQREQVDAIVSFVWFGQIGLFAKQARALGITAPIIGTDAFEDENELKSAEGALEGAWFPQIADPLPEFKQKYESAFPGASIYSAGNCHDIAMLIAEALTRGEKVSDFLNTVKDFPGALGPVSASGDHRFVFPSIIREVRAGKFVTAGQNEKDVRERQAVAAAVDIPIHSRRGGEGR